MVEMLICKFNGCERTGRIRKIHGRVSIHLTKGFCNTHYLKYTRFGTPEGTSRGYNDGRSKHPLYGIYKGMVRRCYANSNKSYLNYGARGIRVSDRWMLEGGEGFKNFVTDIGIRPDEHYTLDRIDNSKGYSAENCRWATIHQQARNKRNNSENIGVSFNKHNKRWIAELTVSGERVFRKGYITLGEAITAKKMADKKFGVII